MGAGGRGRPGAPHHDHNGDPDAMWRPGATVATVDAPAEPGRRPRPRREPGDEPSPWSREWVAPPLPTIAEVRARWRRELDGNTPAPTDRPLEAPAERRAVVVPSQPRSTTTGDSVLVAMIVACVVAVALVIVWSLRPTSSQVDTDVVPASAELRWEAEITSDVAPGMFDADDASVVLIAGGELVVLETSTGAGRWTRSLPAATSHEVGVFGDVVVASSRGAASWTVAGYDTVSGAVVWERTRDDTRYSIRPDGLIEYVDTGPEVVMSVLAPRTGLPFGPASVASELPPPAGHEVGRSGNTLEVYDVASGEMVHPAVPDIGLKALAPVGDAVVGFTPDAEIVLYGERSGPVDQRRFVSAVRGDFPGRAELVGGVPGTSLGIVASGSSIGFDVSGGVIEVVWELLGRVGAPVETEIGMISVARTVHPVTAEIDVELVDAVTGVSVAVTDLGITREAAPVVVRDGYVVAPALGDPDRVVAAFGFDGAERWSLATPPGSWFEVHDGSLYVVDPSEGTLTAHG